MNSKLKKIFKILKWPIKFFVSLKRYGVKETGKTVVRKLWYLFIGRKYFKLDIKTFSEFGKFFLKVYNPQVFFDLLKEYDCENNKTKKKILLVTHEFSLTGAPIAILYFARTLKELGYLPVVVSLKPGALCTEFKDSKIPAFVYHDIFSEDLPNNFIELFDYIVVNTAVSAPFVTKTMYAHKKILWWIHESAISYSEDFISKMPKVLSHNVNVFVAGPYAGKVLKKNFPDYKYKELLYCVPERNKENGSFLMPLDAKGKTVFCTVGTLEKRKAQDILIQAIKELNYEVREKSFFIIVGCEKFHPMYMLVKQAEKDCPQSISYIEQLSPDDMQQLYMQMDCLICPSIDDPMPVVVTESLMNKKTVICSENTGSAAILEKEKVGFVYRNNSPKELAKNIEYFVKNKDNLNDMREKSYEVYKKYFSPEVFALSVKNIFEEFGNENKYEFNGIVSVVIPVFNGGELLKKLIEKLRSQINVGQLEIVVVDSGSTDDSCQICKENGVKLIQITQKEFTHSYSRNLGAENASGDIIVFMTQDALPIGDAWLQEMVAPILSQEAVAVSCKEQCPENTDLYYRITSEAHSSFIGLYKDDVLNEIGSDGNDSGLRIKANLNDVALAIDKSIFMQHKYRFNYAEDLDMGLRLIREGYRIKFLSKTQVLHGHSRDVDYYLKRGYIDQLTLRQIDESFVASRQSVMTAYSIMVGTYLKILNSAKKLKSVFASDISKNVFLTELYSVLAKEEKCVVDTKKIEKTGNELFDEFIKIVNEKLGSENYAANIKLCDSMMWYIENLLIPFMKRESINVLSVQQQNDIIECIWKQFAFFIGGLFANVYPEEISFLSELDFLKFGV